jgi:hypothetical protein
MLELVFTDTGSFLKMLLSMQTQRSINLCHLLVKACTILLKYRAQIRDPVLAKKMWVFHSAVESWLSIHSTAELPMLCFLVANNWFVMNCHM